MANPLNLQHLRHFAAVANERHMTDAAARIGIPIRQLETEIQELEHRIGQRLIVGCPLGLTETGRLLLEEAGGLLAAAWNMEHLVERLRERRPGLNGPSAEA